jgi:hypothetical protein
MKIQRPTTYAELTEEFLTDLNNTLVGMTSSQARNWADENGFICRVTSEDGEGFIVTCDYHLHRINLDLEQDKVVRADLG